jgi:hypothetical protein
VACEKPETLLFARRLFLTSLDALALQHSMYASFEADVFTLPTSLPELVKCLMQGEGLAIGEAVVKSRAGDSRPDPWNCLVLASRTQGFGRR